MYGLSNTALSFMVRMAASSNVAPVKSTSARTEAGGCAVTISGTSRAIFSTSAGEQAEQSQRICFAWWRMTDMRLCIDARGKGAIVSLHNT